MGTIDNLDEFEQITLAKQFPEPDNFSLQLVHLSSEEAYDNESFSALIQSNVEFSAALLSYAKVSCTFPRQTISTVEQAIEVIGKESVAILAIILSLLKQYRHGKCPQFDYQKYWQKALAQGACARALAALQGLDEELFFTFGVLGNLGQLALATAYPTDYARLISENTIPLHIESKEKKLFGLTSTELTCALLSKWRLPENYINALKESDDHTKNDKQFCRKASLICKILTLAGLTANIAIIEQPLAATFLSTERLAERLGIPAGEFGPFFNKFAGYWQATCVFFELPTLDCPDYQQIKTLDDVTLNVPDHNKEPITILAVDDDPITIINLKNIVAGENRTIITAKDGNQAMKLALIHRPDILITDWRMPNLNGIDLCKILRKTQITRHTYIIMLTCNEADEELVQAFDAGADDYVVKPFTPKVLQARILGGERLIRNQRTIRHDRQIIERYAARLSAANMKLQNMAMTDFLTGLPNRRGGLTRLTNLLAEVKRYQEPLSCLMIDIDHFKSVNDNYGHDCGDSVLKTLSRLFEEKARSYDMVSRWGGEEFLIISARSTLSEARQLAERFRKSVENHSLQLTEDLVINVTISIGIATWSSDLKDVESLIKEADRNLYLAKGNGRNRIEPSN